MLAALLATQSSLLQWSGLQSSSLLPTICRPIRARYRAAASLYNTAIERCDQLRITPFWRARLQELTKPAAVSLVPSLSTANALCFENKNKGTRTAGTLVDFATMEKEKRPDHLLLIRVGEFYEAFGLDALMLVQHAGLNPMGSKCRAGCPVQNLQATLDSLTAAGLTVAVYEEVAPAGTAEGRFKKLKQRVVTQIVSPASPVYMYEACLSPHQIEYAEPPPFVGVSATASGYLAVMVHLDSRTWCLHQRLSSAALRALLSARPHAPPLLVNDPDVTPLPRTLRHTERRALNVRDPIKFPRAVLDYVAEEAQVDPASFRQLPSRGAGLDLPPTPIYFSTATQIGLLPTAGIPDLLRAVLPPEAPASCSHLLRRWLLMPPRPSVADAMHRACKELAQVKCALPGARPVPVGKLVSLLLARQANTPLFSELEQLLLALHSALHTQELSRLNDALLTLVAEESGLRLTPNQLLDSSDEAIACIRTVIADPFSPDDEPHTDNHGLIPAAFFHRNENFRGLLRPEVVAVEYREMDRAAKDLCDAVADAVTESGQLVVHDTINNAIYLRKGKDRSKRVDGEQKETEKEDRTDDPTFASRTRDEVAAEAVEESDADSRLLLVPARDRNKRLLANRFVNGRVHLCTLRYLDACGHAERVVKSRLQNLCDSLHPMMPTIVSAAHWVLCSSTLAAHVGHALQSRWALPVLRPAADEQRVVQIEELRPYWLPHQNAAPNTFSWEGIWVLTAPNMAGKSSLMRSMLVAALLANCGLFAPVKSALVPRYDSFFLRTTSFDAPSEGKSAFAQEMDDLQLMTGEGTKRSLLMLDEIGRGTSSREGTALSAALLEWLDERNMNAVFATHLHELESTIAQLPQLQTLQWRTLPVQEAADGSIKMSFTLAEGISRSSLAVHVARGAGLPEAMLTRAEALLGSNTIGVPGTPCVGASNVGSVLADTHFVGSTPRSGNSDAAGMALDEQHVQIQLQKATEVLRSLSSSDEVTIIGPEWQPPPRLRGRSCVYLLQLSTRCRSNASKSATLYVGESDSIAQRLQQHRRKHSNRRIQCVLIEVESKSEALKIETRMIRRLKEMGIGHVHNVANA